MHHQGMSRQHGRIGESMPARTQQSPQFTLALDKTRSRVRYTFMLSFCAQQQRPHSKLKELRDALCQQGHRKLHLREVYFPSTTRHCLLIETTAKARSGAIPTELQDELYELLAPIVDDAIARVDYDLSVNTPTAIVLPPPALTSGPATKILQPNGRKQHRRHVRPLQRQREKTKQMLLARQRAFQDASLAPVVLS